MARGLGPGSRSSEASTRPVRSCSTLSAGSWGPREVEEAGWGSIGLGRHGTAGCPQRGRGPGGEEPPGVSVCLMQGPEGGRPGHLGGCPEQLLTPPQGAPRAPSPGASRTAGRGYAAAWQQPFYSLPALLGPRASSPPPPARSGAPTIRLPYAPRAPPAPWAAPAPLHLITRLSRLLSCS